MALFTISCIFAKFAKLCYFPELFGALITGFVYGNVSDVRLNPDLSATLRSVSLVVILLRAGLELDAKVIRRMSLVCLRMAFIPCIVEVLAAAFATYFLMDFPLKWGFLLGFVLSAASPAIVVPGMLTLQEKHLGTDKGIPTLVIAAASVDDILAITGFSICLGQVFTSEDSLVWTILKGPVEVVVGLAFAIVVGITLWSVICLSLVDTEGHSPGGHRVSGSRFGQTKSRPGAHQTIHYCIYGICALNCNNGSFGLQMSGHFISISLVSLCLYTNNIW